MDNVSRDIIAEKSQKVSKHYKALTAFLVERSVYDNVFNFNDQRENKKYMIKKEDVDTLFDLLEQCRKNNVVTGLSIHQYPTHLNKGDGLIETGICIDIDIKQTTSARLWSDREITILTAELDRIIKSVTEGLGEVPIDHIVMIRAKIEPEQDYYKDGIHILVPEVPVSKTVKQKITMEFKNSQVVASVFNKPEYIMHDKIIDPCMASNNLLLFGCSRKSKQPYEFLRVMSFSQGTGFGKDISHLKDLNLVKEFNLVYEPTFYKRKAFSISSGYESQVESIPQEPREERSSKSITNLDDPNYKTCIELIDLLSVKRATDYPSWRSIVIALAVLSRESECDYRSLGIKFSAKCGEKWKSSAAKDEFNKIWNWARGQSNIKSGIAVLKKAARQDNPEVYDRLKKSMVTAMLTNALTRDEGTLSDFDLAKILYSMYQEKFAYDPSNRKWYEFITKARPGIEPFLMYKYKEMDDPDLLKRYIPEKVPEFLEEIIDYFNLKKDDKANEEFFDWYKLMIKNIKRTSTKLKDVNKMNNVITACRTTFSYHDLHENFDKDPYIVGIGNGVLELPSKRSSPKARLISERHPYKVATFTKVPYLADGMETKVAYIMDKWNSTFREEDVRNFMLLYLSTCLKGSLDYLKLMIWHGPGQDGKSTWMVFLAETLGGGKGYSYKLPSQYYTQAPGKASEHTAHLVGVKKARFVYS